MQFFPENRSNTIRLFYSNAGAETGAATLNNPCVRVACRRRDRRGRLEPALRKHHFLHRLFQHRPLRGPAGRRTAGPGCSGAGRPRRRVRAQRCARPSTGRAPDCGRGIRQQVNIVFFLQFDLAAAFQTRAFPTFSAPTADTCKYLSICQYGGAPIYLAV